MSGELSSNQTHPLLEILGEQFRLEGLTIHQLVDEALSSDASDFLLVQEMMTRLDPTWMHRHPEPAQNETQ